jgi:hypothetical protein
MDNLGPVIFLGLTAWGVWTWIQSGLRVPRFVHVLRLLGAFLGGWMVWLDTTVGEFTWRRAAFMLIVTPWLVYAGFFAYSGTLREERLNDQASRDDSVT